MSTNWVMSNSVGALLVEKLLLNLLVLVQKLQKWRLDCRGCPGAQDDCGPVRWSWPSTNTGTGRSPRWMEMHTPWPFPPYRRPSGWLSWQNALYGATVRCAQCLNISTLTLLFVADLPNHSQWDNSCIWPTETGRDHGRKTLCVSSSWPFKHIKKLPRSRQEI